MVTCTVRPKRLRPTSAARHTAWWWVLLLLVTAYWWSSAGFLLGQECLRVSACQRAWARHDR
ncbi:MAG: hypothetical protein SFU56_20685 [Capsulimonadales bacterium]|nr:hypothetical protein [Capsulimonadales bacterium]